MALTRTNVTIPAELLAQVDELAGPRGRSMFVADAVAARVKRERLRRALDRVQGFYIGTPFEMDDDAAYRWVRALREDPEPEAQQ